MRAPIEGGWVWTRAAAARPLSGGDAASGQRSGRAAAEQGIEVRDEERIDKGVFFFCEGIKG
jgi:hypothetical protein